MFPTGERPAGAGTAVISSNTDEPKLRPESEWFYADVLTCAVPCLSRDIQTISSEDIRKIHTSRAKHILDVACKYEADVYKTVLADYKHAFKTVEFAVYCNLWDSKNYEVFRKCF